MANTAENALVAAAWGILSAISLVIGAVIGVLRNPRKEIRAGLMAYGSGALIEALSIELFAHIVHMASAGSGDGGHRRLGDGGPGKPLVYVAMVMAILGGSCFAGLNKVLNEAGGFARHAAALKGHVDKRRLIFYRRLASKLKAVPMLSGLGMPELQALASKMKKDIFEEGENVFHHEDLHSPMYFLMTGSVRVEICRGQEQRSDLAKTEPQKTDSAKEEELLHVPKDTEDSYLVKPHELFGELALLTGQPLRANAVARRQSKVLKLLTNDFIDLVDEHPEIKRFLANSAGRSMNNTKLFNDSTMDNLIAAMDLVCFSTDEMIYQRVDRNTSVYYLVLGHIWLTYESAEDAFPSKQDPEQESKKRIIRPGKLFGTDNILRGSNTRVRAVAHDRSLCLCLQRDQIERLNGLNASLMQKAEILQQSIAKAKDSSGGSDVILPGACESDAAEIPQSRQLTPTDEAGARERADSKLFAARHSLQRQPTRNAPGLSRLSHDSLEVTDEEVMEDEQKELMGAKNSKASGDSTEDHGGEGGHGHNNSHAAIMIWLGLLIDAVPESVVLGILASTSSAGSLLTFVIGVFLANLPEAMSSSGTMAACGIPRKRILTMWGAIVLLTGVGAAVGAICFPPGSEDEESSMYAIAAIEGMCGGAMLTMIANTALPEAFEQGGNVVGLSCLLGFLSALFVSVVAS